MDKRFIDWNDATRNKRREWLLRRVVECLQESELHMCGDCPQYNEETGECDASPKQIRKINTKYTSSTKYPQPPKDVRMTF